MVSQVLWADLMTRNFFPQYLSISGMNGRASRRPRSSSVVRISSAVRTSTHSPARRPSLWPAGDSDSLMFETISRQRTVHHSVSRNLRLFNPPSLREIYQAVPAVEHASGFVDVGDLNLQRGTHVAVVYDLARLTGNPERKQVLSGNQVEGVDLQLEIAVTGLHFGNMNPMEQMAGFSDQRPHLRIQAEPEARIAHELLGVVVEPEDQAVSAPDYRTGRTVGTQGFESCVPDLAAAQSVPRPRQIGT